MPDALQLAEPDRQKLDGIVSKMHENQEADSDIQYVVNDFKTKYGKSAAMLAPHKTEADYNAEHPESEEIKNNMITGAKGVAEAFNPVNIVKGTVNTVLHPIDTVHGIIALPAHLKELYDSGKNEELTEEIGKALGSVALAKAAPEVPGVVKDLPAAARATGTALTDAGKGVIEANKNPALHVTAGAASVVPGFGHSLAALIEGLNSVRGAWRGFRAGQEARVAAANAVPAIVPPPPTQTIPNVAAGRVPLADAAGIQPEPVAAPSPAPAAVVTPDIAAAAQAQRAANLAARRPAAPKATTVADLVAQAPAETAADKELLDGLSQSLAKKPFARLSSVDQTKVRDIAKKVDVPAPAAASEVPQVEGEVPQVSTPRGYGMAKSRARVNLEGRLNRSVANEEAAADPWKALPRDEMGKWKPAPTNLSDLIQGQLQRLRAASKDDIGGEIEPLHMKAVEPDDYSSMLEQSIEEARAKTLAQAAKNFAKKKDK